MMTPAPSRHAARRPALRRLPDLHPQWRLAFTAHHWAGKDDNTQLTDEENASRPPLGKRPLPKPHSNPFPMKPKTRPDRQHHPAGTGLPCAFAWETFLAPPPGGPWMTSRSC